MGKSSRRKKRLFLHGGTAVQILFNPLENSGGRNMKKLSVLAVALSIATLGIPVLAYGQPQEMKQEEQKPKLMDIKGTVKADGDKITFVADAEGKSWDVVNPETLKDHVGHHVEVSAHVYADKGQIHVMKVTMLKQ
jgi:membrane protein implicated in regulation of membrane protease activity